MGDAKRRRDAKRTVHDPEFNIGYQIRDAAITPRQLLAQLHRAALNNDEVNLPCNGCTQCCHWPRVEVDPAQELPEHLQHLALAQDEDGYHLKKRGDGACIHLGEHGCTVHAYRPHACRSFDCRFISLAQTVFPIDPTHYAPVWVFRIDDDEDKAIMMAARIGLLPHILAMQQTGEAPDYEVMVAAITKSLITHLPEARAFVAKVAKLPEAERAKLQKLVDKGHEYVRAATLRAQTKPVNN